MPCEYRKDNALKHYEPDGAKKIYIPMGVFRIAWRAFANNTDIEIVYLARSVYSIEEHAFENCTNLREVHALGVTHVSPNAFWGCTALTTIEFSPDFKGRIHIQKHYEDVSFSPFLFDEELQNTTDESQDIQEIQGPEFESSLALYHDPYYNPGDVVLLKKHLYSKLLYPDESPNPFFAQIAIISEANRDNIYNIKLLLEYGCTTRNGVRRCFIKRRIDYMPDSDVSIWSIDENIKELTSYYTSHLELHGGSYMEINANTFKLVNDLEIIFASHCYNFGPRGSSYSNEREAYRYPLTYLNNDYEAKTLREICDVTEITDNESINKIIGEMKYKFGANRLYIGEAIVDLLNTLEERYGIDFNELENQYVQRQNKEET